LSKENGRIINLEDDSQEGDDKEKEVAEEE